MRGIVLFFLFFGIFSTLASARNIQIITTIKPVTMLTYAITGDDADVFQLIPDYASVHDYSFKPSDLRKIKRAEVIFRIDEHLESMFNPIFENLPEAIRIVSLAEEGGIQLISLSGKQEKGHGHHHHGNTDLHVWTSPKNAIIMAKTIAQVLIEKDPVNSEKYKTNLQSLVTKIKGENLKINGQLLGLKNTSYIVFHNSWRYFQQDFSLKEPTIISFHENIVSGVRSIINTRKKIQQSHVACVFTDLSINKARLNTLVEGFNVKHIEIDSLGNGIELNKDSYIIWLKTMKGRVVDCLRNVHGITSDL